MPSSSKKQHNFMAAVAHSPSFAKKVGVPQSVGKDFTAADKGKKFMNPRARRTGGAIRRMAEGGNASEWLKNRKKRSGSNPLDNPKYREEGIQDLSPYFIPGGAGRGTAVGVVKVVGKAGKLGNLARKLASGLTSKAKSGIVGGVTGKVEKGLKYVSKEAAKDTATEHALDKGVVEPTKEKLEHLKFARGGAVKSRKVKRYNGEEGSEVKSDSSSQPVTTQSDAGGKRRSFLGSLFTGHLKDYNAQERARRNNVGPKGKDWKKLDKTDASSFDEDEESEAVKATKADAWKKMDKTDASSTDEDEVSERVKASKAPAKKQSFGAWFNEQYKKNPGTVQTWTNPKTGETKRILLKQNSPTAAKSNTPSPAKSHRTSGAGTKSYKPKYSAADAASDTAREGRRAVNQPTDSERSLRKQRRESNTQHDIGRATRIKPMSQSSSSAPQSSSSTRKVKRLNAFGFPVSDKKNAKPTRNARGSMSGVVAKRTGGSIGYCGGGMTKRYAAGGAVSSVSSRADGIASRGRTKCKIC